MLPTNASNAMVHLETGLVTTEPRFWIIVLSYWLKLNHTNSGLAHLILKDNSVSPWMELWENKLGYYGFSHQYLMSISYYQAKSLVKQKILDIERQHDLRDIIGINRNTSMPYISELENSENRRVFMLIRMDMLPSAILDGRYKKISYLNQLCVYGEGRIETLEHVLLDGKIYKQIRESYINPIILDRDGGNRKCCLQTLLEDRNKATTYNVAKFGRLALKLSFD